MLKNKKPKFVVMLIMGVLLAMTICLLIGMRQSVWFDEAYSILVAKQPIDQLIHLTSIDTHPPLYYILLKLWASAFSWNELVLRGFSVLCMGGGMFMAGLLSKKLFGERTAFLSLPFIIFAPFVLRYGFEIRMYALATFIGVTATYVLVNALEQRNDKLKTLYFGLYAVLVAIGVYSLYYTAFIWLAHFAWLAWRSFKNKENIFKSAWLASYVFSVVLFLPWLSIFSKQLKGGALAAIMQPMTVDNLLGTVSFSFLYKPIWQLDAWLTLLFIFVISSIVYFTVKVLKLASVTNRRRLLLIGSYWLMPIIILTLIGLFRPMYVERYMAHFIIAESIFIGAAISSVRFDAVHKTVYALLVGCMLIGVVNLANAGNFNFQRMQYPSIKAAASKVFCEKDRPVIVDNPYEAVEFSYYLSDCDIYFQSDSDNMGGGYAPVSNKGFGISDPKTFFANSKQLTHLYYNDTDVSMPEGMIILTGEKVGDFTIESYISR